MGSLVVSLVTARTLVRFFPRVNSLMSNEIYFAYEILVTDSAVERLLTVVDL